MHAIIVLGGERITSLCAPLPEKALVIAADRDASAPARHGKSRARVAEIHSENYP